MPMFRHLILLLVFCLVTGGASANSERQNSYRNFWYPTFHKQRLNYCATDGKQCGLAVATQYCQLMGYPYADKQVIDNNVGLTRFLNASTECKGWQCNGFKLIRCVNKMLHKPPQSYYYRSQRYAFPRMNHYRIDWCYENGHGCGHQAAYSFCRRMGYMQAKHFKQEKNIAATKALGNQKLCFGKACSSFSEITCYR